MRIAIIALLLAACDTIIPEGTFFCESPQDCPSGWVCGSDSRCYSEADDASMPDSDTDAGADASEPDSSIPMGDGPFGLCNFVGADDMSTCAPDLDCIQYSGGPLICRVPCDADAECSAFGEESVCARQFLAETETYCTWTCTPGTSEGCIGGESCRLSQFPGRSDVARDCTPNGPSGLREACETHFDCNAGLGCVNLDGTRACLAICDSTNPTACPVGSRCTELVTGYGYCTPI